jgi:hypothetical protein
MDKQLLHPVHHRKVPSLLPPYDNDVRIYTVVAGTVYNPLDTTPEGFPRLTPNSKTIIQPYGRMTAQHGHVVGVVRVKMAFEILKHFGNKHIDAEKAGLIPITTIVLQCRDSLELAHVKDLLEEADLKVEEFLDDNPEYGPGKVRTAIGTWPVFPENVIGITDYLPLLKPPKE